MIFDGPFGLRYDSRQHDYIDEQGDLASAERVADAREVPIAEVEADRQWLASRKVRMRPLGDGLFQYEIEE